MEGEEVAAMSLGAPAPSVVVSRFGMQHVPVRVRSLSTFATPDYIDSFTLDTPAARERSVEEWARAVLEEAALSRRYARRFWRLMGLRLGPPPYSSAHVQGWAIAGTGADWIRLETQSWYMSAEAVCLVDDDQVSLSLSLHFDRQPVGRLVWAFVEGPHQRAVPVMLRQAVAVVAGSSPRHRGQRATPTDHSL
jgi:hypothetical protein